ncbi:MAG: AAA family ATPase [Cellvibrionaceae bacterium]|nr:AAA family ATPase [Cellvibrionaceae bacterium]
MAKLIYRLPHIEHARKRKCKKVFEKLSDDYIIRSPVLQQQRLSDLIVEGPRQSWGLIGLHPTLPSQQQMAGFLRLNEYLRAQAYPALTYLAVCELGESLFEQKDASLTHVSIVPLDEFYRRGEHIIADSLVSVNAQAHAYVKKQLVPETVINAACTTRRQPVVRDSKAQLASFFLDYDQELAAKYDILDELKPTDLDEHFSVRLINGVAGCGKTLILINRARLYCQKYPQRKALLLIHNKPITEEIKYKFTHYLGGRPRNLHITTFHAYAHAQQRKLSGYVKSLMTDKDKQPFMAKILNTNHRAYRELALSDQQIESELDYINDFLIENKASYLAYDRQGRGFALSRAQRDLIWQLYQLQVTLMSSPREGYLPSLYIRDLCLAKQATALDRYDHILVDEAQFFFPSWLELLKKSIKDNGQLFLCADPNQGFLKSRLSWKTVGLNVRGRTKKLNYSYRTTYEIMVAANALLEHLDEDTDDFIQPDLEKMERGSKPQVIYSAHGQDEQKRFLNELADCVSHANIPLQHIIVLCSNAISPWTIKRVIEAKLGPDKVVNCNHREDLEHNLGNKIRLMTINSCTGMEAGVVFVIGVGDVVNQANHLALSSEEKIIAHQQATRKLYVAMTRAGQKLILFSTAKLPDHVTALMTVSGEVGR